MICRFPGWFIVPLLIFAIVQLFAINTIDLYSSGVTLQAWSRGCTGSSVWRSIPSSAAAFAAYAIFSSRFFRLLTDFLLSSSSGWGRGCYLPGGLAAAARPLRPAALLNERGRYFRNGGSTGPPSSRRRSAWSRRRSGSTPTRPTVAAALQPGRRLGLQRVHRAVLRRDCLLAAGPPVGPRRR